MAAVEEGRGETMREPKEKVTCPSNKKGSKVIAEAEAQFPTTEVLSGRKGGTVRKLLLLHCI